MEVCHHKKFQKSKFSAGVQQCLFRVFHLLSPDEIYLDQAENQVGGFVVWEGFLPFYQVYYMGHFFCKIHTVEVEPKALLV